MVVSLSILALIGSLSLQNFFAKGLYSVIVHFCMCEHSFGPFTYECVNSGYVLSLMVKWVIRNKLHRKEKGSDVSNGLKVI